MNLYIKIVITQATVYNINFENYLCGCFLCADQDIVLDDKNGSPFKAKRGIPSWYEGRVSAAFAKHIFWPSPPKKAIKTRRVLFPACASTQQWRQLHRENSIVTKKFYKSTTIEKSSNACEMKEKKKKLSASRKLLQPILQNNDCESHAADLTAPQQNVIASVMANSTVPQGENFVHQLLPSTSIAVTGIETKKVRKRKQPVARQKDTQVDEQVAVPLRKRRKTQTVAGDSTNTRIITRKSNRNSRVKKAQSPLPSTHSTDAFYCLLCGEKYSEPPTEEWIQCTKCKQWIHEECADVSGGVYYCDDCT
jgi:hypothetical protein